MGYKDPEKRRAYYRTEKGRAANRLERYNLRVAFLELYGNFCHGCGEEDMVLLTLDHVKGQRGQKREGSDKAYRRAVKTFNLAEFRVLCHNCQYLHRIGRLSDTSNPALRPDLASTARYMEVSHG